MAASAGKGAPPPREGEGVLDTPPAAPLMTAGNAKARQRFRPGPLYPCTVGTKTKARVKPPSTATP